MVIPFQYKVSLHLIIPGPLLRVKIATLGDKLIKKTPGIKRDNRIGAKNRTLQEKM